MLIPRSAAIQLCAGIIVVVTLLRTMHARSSKAIKFLLCHMFLMEALNIIGCVTAIVELRWCLGPLRRFSNLHGAVNSPEVLWSQYRKWQSKLLMTYKASNTAFILCGLLTDGILVSFVYNFPRHWY